MATRSKRVLSAQSQGELPITYKRRKLSIAIEKSTTLPKQKTQSKHGLSKRGWSNVGSIMPKIQAALEQRNKPSNPNIDLSTAENWLVRPEIIKICKTAISTNLQATHLSYPPGFSGDPSLLAAYANLFNTHFAPHTRVEPSHLATAPGAAACIDALLYNICEAGDGVLVPGPYWNGFDFSMRVRAGVTPVVVSFPSLTAGFTGAELVDALETAYRESSCVVKAVVVTNPHNPLGLCYPKTALEACLRFCNRHGIHFISDEVYALSVFSSPDLPRADPFISVLSLNLHALGVDASRVHVVWSMSKDFGQSGFRMGCAVSQGNAEMAVGLALAANTQISSLATVCVVGLLSSPELEALVRLNRERLATAYERLTGVFKIRGVRYIPCTAGLFVFAKLARDATTWEEEANMVAKLKDAGVLVSAGRAYHGPESEKGWMRVGFAVEGDELEEAIRRIDGVLLDDTKKEL